MAWLDPAQPDGHRILTEGSFYGNPISMAAVAATLRELQRPGAHEHLHRVGNAIAERLVDAFARRGIAIQSTGVGPLVEFYVSDVPIRDYVSAQRTDQSPKVALAAGLRGRGVFGGGGRYNVSLAHRDAEVEALIAAVEDVLDRDLVAARAG
jgi:glutamate-1-semialdehyde 2,1-aminomutase